jgi:hypothetical protein
MIFLAGEVDIEEGGGRWDSNMIDKMLKNREG